jgi:ribokinase
VIRPNASEAEALTGVSVQNRASARQAAATLITRGVEAVAVQAGDEGNLLVWRDHKTHECWLPKVAVESVDATGAGDAFAAALAVMLAEDRLYEEAGPFANAAAALATTKFGAQAGLPQRDQVLGLLARSQS